MSQIEKYKPLSPEAKHELQQAGLDDLLPGDIFISNNRHEIIRIIAIKEWTWKWDEKRDVTETYVLYEEAQDWEGTEWETGAENQKPNTNKYIQYHKKETIKDFKTRWGIDGHYDAVKLERGKTIKQYIVEAHNVIAGTTSVDTYRMQKVGEVNEERALMHKGSKAALIAMQQDLEARRREAKTIMAFVGMEMERKRQELDKIKNQLYGVVAEFEKKIERIMRVITTIELYLGIDEELFQIQDGPRAAAEEPIQFRQAVLFMDEEIGYWQKGGLDWRNIEWFDEWLIKDQNFKKLLPEKKGMVVFRPRRKDKYYSDDIWQQFQENAPNKEQTYLLIRNGEALYRVFTEKIVILPRLFPQRKELEEILEEAEKEIKRYGEDSYSSEKAKEKVDDLLYQYKMRAALMQGLIDRTEIFHPMAKPISIYRLHESEGLVNFIYDDEAILPSGRLPFWEWVAKLNKSITEGSRVLFTGAYDTYHGFHRRRDFEDRFFNLRGENPTIPELPYAGVYTVESFGSSFIHKMRKNAWEALQQELTSEENKKYKIRLVKIIKNRYLYGYVPGNSQLVQETRPRQEGFENDLYIVEYRELDEKLTIRYKPDSKTAWTWNGAGNEDRKYQVRFAIQRDDTFLLNYDQIDLDDVNFYLTSRVDRKDYLSMMPVLERIREQRLKEIANEKEFIRFVVGRNQEEIGDKGEAIRRVLESIRWWKYKNKWKRAISKDDTLALRMIERRITSANYDTFEKYNNRE